MTTLATPVASPTATAAPATSAIPSPAGVPVFASLADIANNRLLLTDSYKLSQYLQYPPGTTHISSYIESRGGKFDRTLFFGLQYILKEYFAKPITRAEVVAAKEVALAHGEPFNEAGWLHIVDVHGGRLPLRILALPEGSVVPVATALVVVENTDPACAWLASYMETVLMRVWYPVTVATQSWMAKQLIRQYLEETGDVAGLDFKLHDFGARGVSSLESAVIGGAAHLVNFKGTDTLSGLLGARAFYGEEMAGFSVPASEHSTITSWGREREVDAYRNMLTQFAKPGAIVSVVSDSYDIYAATSRLWGGELRQAVIDSGATLVVRPDSGVPEEVVLKVVRLLDQAFGSLVNAKGYRVLEHVRVLQGDGIDLRSIRSILANLKLNGYSADNVVFGMGGALLQAVNRDTQRFAMKCSAACVEGQWREVFKDPVTDRGKTSKKGRLTTLSRGSEWRTATLDEAPQLLEQGWQAALHTVFEDGVLKGEQTFAAIRARAEAASAGFEVPMFSAA